MYTIPFIQKFNKPLFDDIFGDLKSEEKQQIEKTIRAMNNCMNKL